MNAALLAARLVGGVVLLLANGFFVVTEFSLTRVRQFPESAFDGPGLRRAWEMTEELEVYLSGCQVGITIASVGLGVVAEPGLSYALGALGATLGVEVTHALAAVLAFGLVNFAHVVVGEQIPTYLGVERTLGVVRYGAPGLYYWTKLCYPVIRLADWLAKATLSLLGVEMTRAWTEDESDAIESRADLRAAMGDVLERGVVSEERREEVLGALEIGSEPVREVAVPRADVVALSTGASLDENLARMREHPHTRFPLVGDDLDDFRGIVYTPVVLREYDALRAGETSLAEHAHDPMTVAADASVAAAIDAFQAREQELALVVDDGDVMGMVTPTDAFEAITGELGDPVEEPE